jgi:hypothetical protein
VVGLSSTASKCQGVVAGAPHRGRPSMKQFIRIGVEMPSGSVLGFGDASPSRMMLSDHAARSMI